MMMIEKDDDKCKSTISNLFQVLQEYSNKYDDVSLSVRANNIAHGELKFSA